MEIPDDEFAKILQRIEDIRERVMRFDELPMTVQQELFLWRAVGLIIALGGLGLFMGWIVFS